MIKLAASRDGALRPALPQDRDAATWHRVLTAEIAAHLTPAHAALLAEPVPDEGGTTWLAPGSAMRRFADLSLEDRNRLTAAATAILSDIRRLAESGAAPAVAAAWPALRGIPDLTHLFAVDGRPVLAAWGFAAPDGQAGPLAAWDDGVPWTHRPAVSWPVYDGTLVALAVFALVAGLLLAPLGGAIMPMPQACAAAPGTLLLLRDLDSAAARADALRVELAQLTEDHGDRALQCPIPRVLVAAPPPPPPPPAPPPAPPPTPRPATVPPDDRLRMPTAPTRDYGFLQGCWRTDSFQHRPNEVPGVSIYCFDVQGHGSLTFAHAGSGATCRAPATARFDGPVLRLDDSQTTCSDGTPWNPDHLVCQRGEGDTAYCTGDSIEPRTNQPDHWTVNLHKVPR